MKPEIVPKKPRWRQKPVRQLEVVARGEQAQAVAVQKRPRAELFAAAVVTQLLALVIESARLGALTLVREIGPGIEPLARDHWEKRIEKGVR